MTTHTQHTQQCVHKLYLYWEENDFKVHSSLLCCIWIALLCEFGSFSPPFFPRHIFHMRSKFSNSFCDLLLGLEKYFWIAVAVCTLDFINICGNLSYTKFRFYSLTKNIQTSTWDKHTAHTHMWTCGGGAEKSFTKRKRSSHSAKAAKMNRVNTLERNSAFRVSSLSDHTTCIAAWYANWVCMVGSILYISSDSSQPTNEPSQLEHKQNVYEI